MIWIGIDPGLNGAVAVIENRAVRIFDAPTMQDTTGRGTIDAHACAQILLAESSDCFVCIERSQPMPKNGSISGFKLGLSFGIWCGIMAALGVRYKAVRPQEWKTMLLPRDRVNGDKSVSIRAACELYPAAEVLLQRAKDDGRAEALLIAEYGRRVTFDGKVLLSREKW